MLCAYNFTYHIHCSFSGKREVKAKENWKGGKCQNHLDFSMICSFFSSRLIKVSSNFSHVICITWGEGKMENLVVSKPIKVYVKTSLDCEENKLENWWKFPRPAFGSFSNYSKTYFNSKGNFPLALQNFTKPNVHHKHKLKLIRFQSSPNRNWMHFELHFAFTPIFSEIGFG